jgi:hypothetical protein
MSGKHSRPVGGRCTCTNDQITHTCSLLSGKSNHNYDENATQTQAAPMRRVNSVDSPPPEVSE